MKKQLEDKIISFTSKRSMRLKWFIDWLAAGLYDLISLLGLYKIVSDLGLKINYLKMNIEIQAHLNELVISDVYPGYSKLIGFYQDKYDYYYVLHNLTDGLVYLSGVTGLFFLKPAMYRKGIFYAYQYKRLEEAFNNSWKDKKVQAYIRKKRSKESKLLKKIWGDI